MTTARRLSRRERWMVGGVLAVVAALAVVLVVALATGGRSSGHGCIYATVPGAVGAQEIYQCGAEARATCQSAAAPGGLAPPAAVAIEQQCRQAGLPVGG